MHFSARLLLLFQKSKNSREGDHSIFVLIFWSVQRHSFMILYCFKGYLLLLTILHIIHQPDSHPEGEPRSGVVGADINLVFVKSLNNYVHKNRYVIVVLNVLGLSGTKFSRRARLKISPTRSSMIMCKTRVSDVRSIVIISRIVSTS